MHPLLHHFFLREFCLGRILYPDVFLQLKIRQSLTTLAAVDEFVFLSLRANKGRHFS